jgi:hypothetical protein
VPQVVFQAGKGQVFVAILDCTRVAGHKVHVQGNRVDLSLPTYNDWLVVVNAVESPRANQLLGIVFIPLNSWVKFVEVMLFANMVT